MEIPQDTNIFDICDRGTTLKTEHNEWINL